MNLGGLQRKWRDDVVCNYLLYSLTFIISTDLLGRSKEDTDNGDKATSRKGRGLLCACWCTSIMSWLIAIIIGLPFTK